MKKSLYSIIIFSCLLQGCSLAPQTRNTSPYFDGTIKFNGEPVVNMKVMLSQHSKDGYCHTAIQTTMTNKRGEFSLQPGKEEKSYTPFLNYELDEWVICGEYNEQRYTLYTNNRYASGNVSESIVLDCDLVLRPLNKPCITSH